MTYSYKNKSGDDKDCNNRVVYLDYAATSPMLEVCNDFMRSNLCEEKGGFYSQTESCMRANPNTLYSLGRTSFADLEAARKDVASLLGAKRPSEIVFLSGATEAINTGIIGIAKANYEKKLRHDKSVFENKKPSVLVFSIDHDAVVYSAKSLLRCGFDVKFLKPNKLGFLSLQTLKDCIDNTCVLVCVQLANSEIGSIQDVGELTKIAHAYGACFFCDCVQAVGKMPVNFSDLGIDGACVSSHKIGGPASFGCLYLKNDTPAYPMLLGGGQESGFRSGTQNVVAAVCFAKVLEDVCEHLAFERERLAKLKEKLVRGLCEFEDKIYLTIDFENATSKKYLCNIVNFCIKGIESQTAILRFDEEGICVSGGSACSSASLKPSRVLTDIGLPEKIAQSAIRVSFGRYTTEDDIDRFFVALRKVISW